jgi:hypothetical protein
MLVNELRMVPIGKKDIASGKHLIHLEEIA